MLVVTEVFYFKYYKFWFNHFCSSKRANWQADEVERMNGPDLVSVEY